MDTLLWYWAISWDYVAQMLPCMLLAALVFFLMRPWRKKRLAGKVWPVGDSARPRCCSL